MPLFMKLPIRDSTMHVSAANMHVVNLEQLNAMFRRWRNCQSRNIERARIYQRPNSWSEILGNGELTKKVNDSCASDV